MLSTSRQHAGKNAQKVPKKVSTSKNHVDGVDTLQTVDIQ